MPKSSIIRAVFGRSCILLGTVILLWSAACQNGQSDASRRSAPVIMRVGEQDIGLDEFLFFVDKSYPEAKPDLDDQLLSRFFDRFKQDILLAEHAKMVGLRVTQEQIDRFIEIEMPGMTFRLLTPENQEKWMREIRRRLAIQQFLQREIVQQISIPEGAVQAYYEDHQDRYRRPAEYRIRHVQTSDPERAEACRKALRDSKEPFTKVAAEFSENDGYLLAPALELEALPEAFQKELVHMKPGQYSRVASVQYGDATYYHVLYLESMRPAFTISLEDASPDILKTLEKEEAARILKSKLDLFEKKVSLTVFKDRLPFTYVPVDQRGDSR